MIASPAAIFKELMSASSGMRMIQFAIVFCTSTNRNVCQFIPTKTKYRLKLKMFTTNIPIRNVTSLGQR
jgi:hypothetical protein